MANASDMANDIARLLPNLKKGSLVVFGDIFGGPIDNIHRVIAAEGSEAPEKLVVKFDEGETLEIWDPSDGEFRSKTFRVISAARVRWEWFYYGHAQTPENGFFIEYGVVDDRGVVTTNEDWARRRFTPLKDRNAVELLNGWND